MTNCTKSNSIYSKRFLANKDNLSLVLEFVVSSIGSSLDTKEKNKLLIVIEEVFINIASYAYKDEGYCDIEVSLKNNELNLVFSDNGIEFNPLAKEDPNVDLDANEREVGGLGIFMVKNLMDEVHYEYKENKNILTIVKRY